MPNAAHKEDDPMTTFDLTQASVRPAGSGGMASRTAAGFVVLASDDGADLVTYVTEHQMAPDLIERLADQISDHDPRSMAMLFTSGGNPYLLAWGQAVASVASGAARFTVTPLAGQLLVHPLSLDVESTIVLSDGMLSGDPDTAPINLAEGSMHADAVVVELGGEIPKEWQLPSADAAPIADPAEPAPVPADLAASTPVDVGEAMGQPAAQGIVFADDIKGINDLVEPAAFDAPSAVDTPATPFSSQAAAIEPGAFDTQQAETALIPAPTQIFGDPAPAEPAVAEPMVFEPASESAEFDAPMVIPLVRSESESAPAVSPVAQIPPAMPADAPAPQVPPEFRRDVAPDPVEPEPDSAVSAIPAAPAAAVPATPATSPAPPLVLGVVCPQGHHNHPEAVYCSQCGTKMGVHQTTVLVNGPRPALGVLVVDDGTTFSIDSDLVIGRDPASHVDVRAGAAGAMVLVDDTLALSRQHARIVLDDWDVHVADLGSSNGTWLNRGPNPQEWMVVEAGSTVLLQPGDRVKVGGRVIQVELHHIR